MAIACDGGAVDLVGVCVGGDGVDHGDSRHDSHSRGILSYIIVLCCYCCLLLLLCYSFVGFACFFLYFVVLTVIVVYCCYFYCLFVA